MKCPHCHQDDCCWTIRKDEVKHIPCNYNTSPEDMLDWVRALDDA